MSSKEQRETEPIPTWQDVAILMGGRGIFSYVFSTPHFTFTTFSRL